MHYFYGALLIILGIVLLIRYVFKIKIPVFMISLAIIILFSGVAQFVKGPELKPDNNIIFGNKTIPVALLDKECNLIFSTGTIDLTKIAEIKPQKVKINTVFAESTITIDQTIPVYIKTKSAFAYTETPDNSAVVIGSHEYMTKSFNKDANYIEIDANVIFGLLTIKENVKPKT